LPRLRFTLRWMMLALAGIALACGGFVCRARSLENRLSVENQSGQPIAWLKIGMGHAGPIATLKDLPDGGAESASFIIRGDDGSVLDGMLADGTTFGGNFGYVTNGEYRERPRFIVLRGGKIDFTQ
jgi:hypothetical protein